MSITPLTSDAAALRELGTRLMRYRLDRNLTQEQIAREAGISKRTLERIESGGSAQLSNLLRLLRVLGLIEGLDALVPEPSVRPLQRLEHRGSQRKRASRGNRTQSTTPKPWTWDEKP